MSIPFWTLSGTVDLMDLRPENLTAAIIADSLSKTNRFSGQTPQPWPVSAHSVLVERLVGRLDLGPWALLHDAHEAFLGDITTPAVEMIARDAPDDVIERAIQVAKGRIDRMIGAAWKLPVRSMSLELRRADRIALFAESITFLGARPQFLEPRDEEDVDRAISLLMEMPACHDWRAACDLWLSRVERYSGLGLMSPPQAAIPA